MKSIKIIYFYLFLSIIFVSSVQCALLELTNYKSGISMIVEGVNGNDYAVERFYHDPAFDDHSVVYIKDNVKIRLEHNEHNVISTELYILYRESTGWTWLGPDGIARSGDERIIGITGPDGVAGTGDEGKILFKIDRDEQAHVYYDVSSPAVNEYTGSFSLSEFTYEETGEPVVGTVGSNGADYGARPQATRARYHRGIRDQFEDEWHTLTYWDDEYGIAPVTSGHRQALSDGKCVYLVVNPKTPLISFDAPSGEQYYTTPPKAYNIPIIHEQTTYITGGTLIQFFNITDGSPVYYKVDNGNAITYSEPFTAISLGTGEHIIEYWFDDEYHKTRKIAVNPDFPSRGENNGNLLWKDANRLSYIQGKFNREPFKRAYARWKSNLENNFSSLKFPLTERPYWRGWCRVAGHAFNHIIPFYIENKPISDNPEFAKLSKAVLLDLFVVDPVGCESAHNNIPAPDRIGIPNSGQNAYIAAPLAYDLLIGKFKSTDHPAGVTPIEDYKIRDNLASQVHMLQFMRANTAGSDTPDRMVGYIAGDMHWGLGYEMLMYTIGIAMPSYSTPYYGTSGFDGSAAQYSWTPFPDHPMTWWDIVAEPSAPSYSYPDNISIRRFELCYKPFDELMSYPHDKNALWDFPAEGTFWIAANAFNGGNGVYQLGEKDPAELTREEVMLIPDGEDADALGLQSIWTITGRICQKAGIGRNRSFNLFTVTDANDGLWHTEFHGYETPFVPNLILVNYLHKLHYEKPVSDSVEGYLDTKLDRINGDFDPHYLKQNGSSGNVLDANRNPIPLDNSEFLAAAVPLRIYNPIISSKGQAKLVTISSWIDDQWYFYLRKLSFAIIDMILFEDDPGMYASIPTPQPPVPPEPPIGPHADIPDITSLQVSNNIIKKAENTSAIIQCNLKEAGNLSVKIYDAKGREIITLLDGHREAGSHKFLWAGKNSSGNNIGSGIYIVYMKAGNFEDTKKIAVVK